MIAISGGVSSNLSGPNEPVAQLFAASYTGALVTIRLSPSCSTTLSCSGGLNSPRRSSTAAQLTVTGALYQPAGLGSRSAVPVTVGAVPSADGVISTIAVP